MRAIDNFIHGAVCFLGIAATVFVAWASGREHKSDQKIIQETRATNVSHAVFSRKLSGQFDAGKLTQTGQTDHVKMNALKKPRTMR